VFRPGPSLTLSYETWAARLEKIRQWHLEAVGREPGLSDVAYYMRESRAADLSLLEIKRIDTLAGKGPADLDPASADVPPAGVTLVADGTRQVASWQNSAGVVEAYVIDPARRGDGSTFPITKCLARGWFSMGPRPGLDCLRRGPAIRRSHPHKGGREPMTRSLSIVIPAYNEAGNILGTLTNVTTALAPLSLDAEILVIDDGSTDGTGALVTGSRDRFLSVTLLVNERNMGFGWTYRRGVDAASGEYIVMVHGDNAWGAETLREFFSRVGEADVIIGYTRDMWRTRSVARTVVSKAFTLALNLITRRRLKYYNGLQIHKASVLKGLTIESVGYGFQAEVLTKSLRLTRSFIEVPMDLMEREAGESKAFRLKNVRDVLRTLSLICRLEWGLAAE
jgi:hypothetical protein